MRELHTAGPALDAAAAVAAEPRDGGGRPWVLVNMIASLDGAATASGRTGSLGGPADKAVFHALRSVADAVLVGAGTVRAERYGPLRTSGTLAVVSGSLDLDPELPLFGGEARPLVLTIEDAEPAAVAALTDRAEVVAAGRGRVEPGRALEALAERGAGVVLCEGGPTLLGELHDLDLVDEWCVTVAPLALGGPAMRIATSPTEHVRDLYLARAWEQDGMLLLRYLRER